MSFLLWRNCKFTFFPPNFFILACTVHIIISNVTVAHFAHVLYIHTTHPSYTTQYDSDVDSEYGTTPTSKRTKKSRRRKKKKTTIYDVYEPSELERGHFLERDTEIRVTDIPER